MNNSHGSKIRVLGISPSSRGFGFALMEGAHILLNWGVKTVKGGNKNARSLSNAANLLTHYVPDLLAIEDIESSRRCDRVKELGKEIIALALAQKVDVKLFSRQQVTLGILENERGTKHALAEYLATRFADELGFRLPRKRRLWTSEPYQMDIFDAVGLAVHVFRK